MNDDEHEPVRQVLYGGARGFGKTAAQRAAEHLFFEGEHDPTLVGVSPLASLFPSRPASRGGFTYAAIDAREPQVIRRRPRMPRWWRHLRAQLGAYFWLPCPICGEHFAGHEWRDVDKQRSTIPTATVGGVGTGICPPCTRAGYGTYAWRRYAAQRGLPTWEFA